MRVKQEEKPLGPQASIKKFKKSEREIHVLFGLVRLYLKTLKPVGSNSLRENGFGDLSSATIRNYFAKLEERGLLEQPHTSGGRTPTWHAFKLFATSAEKAPLPSPLKSEIRHIGSSKTKKVFEFLQKVTEQLSQWTGGAAFISMPHFEQDSIIDIHLVKIDAGRLLGVLVTSFGMVHTHTLLIDHKLSEHGLRRIEDGLQSQLNRTPFSQKLSESELKVAEQIYQELLTRHLLSQSDALRSDQYKTGFSRLLKHPAFGDSRQIAGALELFENPETLALFTRSCLASSDIHSWIGGELEPFSQAAASCAVCTVNYSINHIPVGAIGILLPLSSDYPAICTLLYALQEQIQKALETNVYTYKLSWKQSGAKASPALLQLPLSHVIEHKGQK